MDEGDLNLSLDQSGNEPLGGGASWFDGLPDDLKANEAVGVWKDKEPADVLKHALDLEGKLGSRLEIPTQESTPEVKQKFVTDVRKALGVPDSPDGYALKLPDGIPASDPLLQAFVKEGHAKGYTTEQVQSAIDLVSKYQVETQQQLRDEGVKALQTLWPGDSFKTNLDAAHTAIAGLAKEAGLTQQEVDFYLDDSNMGHAVPLVRMLAVAGRFFKEDSLKGGNAGTDDGKAMLNKLYPSMA